MCTQRGAMPTMHKLGHDALKATNHRPAALLGRSMERRAANVGPRESHMSSGDPHAFASLPLCAIGEPDLATPGVVSHAHCISI